MALTFARSELIALGLESVLYGAPPFLLFALGVSLSHPVLIPPGSSCRTVRFPLRVVRQGPLQQATAKGWGKLPPHPGLAHSLRPHNLGSYPPLCLTTTCHSYPLQHLVTDIVRLYIAFEKSETDQGADLYFIRVTAPLSVVKTSIYLAETVVSDMFIVCASKYLSSMCDLPSPLSAISVLYRLECERPHRRSPNPSISRRHRYVLAIISNADVLTQRLV